MLEAAFNHAPTISVIVDRDGHITDINKTGERLLASPREEMLGRLGGEVFRCLTAQHAVCGRTSSCAHCPIRSRAQHTFDTGNPVYREIGVLPISGPDGPADFHFEITTTPLKIDGEDRVLIVLIDQTAYVKQRQQLELNEERLRLASDATGIGWWDWSIPEDRCTISARWAEIIGYAPGELQPLNTDAWHELAHPDDVAEADRLMMEHFLGKRDSYQLEARLRHKQGHYVWVQVQGRVVERDEDGNPVRMIGSHRDVTAEHSMQQELAQLVDEKTRLMKEVLHRAKNNFANVAGLLYMQRDALDNADARSAIADAEARVKVMADIHEFLYREQSPDSFRLDGYLPVLAESVRLCYSDQRRTPALRLSLDQACIPSDWAVHLGVLVNEILTNAYKYAFPDGFTGDPVVSIELSARNRVPVTLSVSDNGVGMDPAFDPEQSDSLGLRLIYSTARSQLRARIVLDRHTGTRWTLMFPEIQEIRSR